MRIGASPYGSTRGTALDFAGSLVSAGIDTLWLGDGMFLRPDFAMWRGGLESMTSLAWFAGRFPAARIGITAAVLPVRDMDWLAREATTLDHLTNGNFVLAVAAGFWADELERFRAMGVADISLVLGHDDASSRSTLEVLAADVLPAMREAKR